MTKINISDQNAHGKAPTDTLNQPNSLQDSWGRQFRYLRLSLTDVCNMRCTYCLPDGYQRTHNEQFLTSAEVTNIVRAFARLGTRKIRLTGGEPSLRQDLPQIIEDCKATSGITQVAVTTNGLKLARLLDDWKAAGLDQINISVDSLTADSFALITGHDRLSQLLGDIDQALADQWTLKVNAVLLRGQNDRELPAFLNWLRDRPLTLRFIELMRTNDNADYYQQHHLRGAVWMQQLMQQGWQELPRSEDSGPAREFWHPNYAGRIGFILPYAPSFCASCNRLRVSARGDLHLCLFTEQGHSLRDLLQSPEQLPQLQQRLQQLLHLKAEQHPLLLEQSGGNRHFAAIGG
ncbi:cyclic pyranopterin phosphate synthase [Azomonas agilis]|uniref:GTP 3',8-cyclase n=1 Tax=Azomonas agilis TaxID=116849 RepID=A0A562J0R3_9GAMM|nr:GTP 3',8-cyclase MoaA [Azomonas agilis]TWH76776.1 cyclic pyranopterin phosphate synthase [Azomonas agilis]